MSGGTRTGPWSRTGRIIDVLESTCRDAHCGERAGAVSHFRVRVCLPGTVTDIDDAVSRVLAPYDENMVVEPYRVYEAGTPGGSLAHRTHAPQRPAAPDDPWPPTGVRLAMRQLFAMRMSRKLTAAPHTRMVTPPHSEALSYLVTAPPSIWMLIDRPSAATRT